LQVTYAKRHAQNILTIAAHSGHRQRLN
jgi:hypothetical protein